MSEEFENQDENKECGCGENCHCNDDVVEYDYSSSPTEKLFVVSAVANIVTAVIVTAFAGTVFFNMYKANKAANPKPAKAEQAQPADEAIFAKKSMSLEDAMKGSKTAIVLFYADWCPHCRNFAPTFKELEKDRQLKKKYNFVRINSEDPAAQKTMQEYGIQGFPSLFMVNPKSGEKKQVDNYLMFGDNAKSTLTEIFSEFDGK